MRFGVVGWGLLNVCARSIRALQTDAAAALVQPVQFRQSMGEIRGLLEAARLEPQGAADGSGASMALG